VTCFGVLERPENANVPPTESTTEPAPNNIKPTSDVPRAAVASKNNQRASLNQPVANLPQTSPRLGGSLGLSGFVASGFAPAPSFGVELVRGLLVNRHWALSLEPQVTGPSSHPSSLGPSIRVRTWSRRQKVGELRGQTGPEPLTRWVSSGLGNGDLLWSA